MPIGRDSSIADILPQGMSPDDFYVFMAGAAAFLTVMAVGSSLMERDRLGPRLKALQERRAELKGDLMRTRRRDHMNQGSISLMRKVLKAFNLLQNKQATAITETLVSAGWRSKDAVIVYVFFKLVTPIILLFMSIPLASTMQHPAMQFLVPVAALFVGLKLPNLMVINHRTKRWQAIQRGLPDALDLMMVCAEAGLTLSATLDRVARELGIAYPELADELTLTSIEIGFLPERKKALENLQKRVDIPEIRGMVSVLIQTEKYGTPIAQALRVLSKEFRQQRTLRAEQKAARLPAIMTIPMIVFILPCLFIVVMTPAVLQLIDELAKQ